MFYRSDSFLSFSLFIVAGIQIVSKYGIFSLKLGRINPIIKLLERFSRFSCGDNSNSIFLAGVNHGPDDSGAEVKKLKARSERLACLEEISVGNVRNGAAEFSHISKITVISTDIP
jgi:hypothetical protein